jgi:hypothetical protein
LFEISRGNISNQKTLIPDSKGVVFIAQNDCNNGFVGKVQKQLHRVFKGNSLIIGRQTGVVYYQENDFITTDGVLVLSAINNFIKNNCIGLFITSILSKELASFGYGYTNTVSTTKLNKISIQLPTSHQNGEAQIAFDFMEAFIATLKAERLATLKAYLTVTGLSNTTLTHEEESVLASLEAQTWKTFNLEELFGKSTRGRRLKSADRIEGSLPFVTAGEANAGISAWIGNNVHIFSKNTVTIDMFGSAKYRGYNYGADDHVAVVHSEKWLRFAVLFLTACIHKSSHAGQFDYSRNFYAKDADELNIQLPISTDGTPDYAFMETFVSALQKVVIQGVVSYLDERIEKTGELV